MTLGIPRLREILMTASRKIALPVMTLPLLGSCGKQDAEALAIRLSRITLAQVGPKWHSPNYICTFASLLILDGRRTSPSHHLKLAALAMKQRNGWACTEMMMTDLAMAACLAYLTL